MWPNLGHVSEVRAYYPSQTKWPHLHRPEEIAVVAGEVEGEVVFRQHRQPTTVHTRALVVKVLVNQILVEHFGK